MRKLDDGLTPQQRYDRKACVGLYLKLNRATDADILARLESVESKQGYIKSLIRADIARSGKTTKPHGAGNRPNQNGGFACNGR